MNIGKPRIVRKEIAPGVYSWQVINLRWRIFDPRVAKAIKHAMKLNFIESCDRTYAEHADDWKELFNQPIGESAPLGHKVGDVSDGCTLTKVSSPNGSYRYIWIKVPS